MLKVSLMQIILFHIIFKFYVYMAIFICDIKNPTFSSDKKKLRKY